MVRGLTDALIPWPFTRHDNGTGRAYLILCGDLARAVRCESEQAVAHHWGVCITAVWKWRRVLGIHNSNEGTKRLRQANIDLTLLTDAAKERSRAAAKRPERNEKVAASKRGKPRPAHVQEILRTAQLGRHPDEATRTKMSEAHRQRGTRPPAAGPPWTAEEDAILGTVTDRAAAARLGRSAFSVFVRRQQLGIPSFRPHKPVSAAREWTPAEDAQLGTASDQELAERLGCTTAQVGYRRRQLSIASHAPRRHVPPRAWLPEEDTLLGTMPDATLAERLRCAATTVFGRRVKLGVPPYRGVR